MSTAIRFDHVSKRFTLHHQRPRSFQELVIELFKKNGESAGPRLGARGGAASPGREDFWALRDVSFEVKHGETFGIIGPNGAGKSTVLKLVSRIIEPTIGEIEVNGRIGALLELGAGFHPDLSGRENIYLNGSILGLDRNEIDKKLDQIIAFAELERFIDMPIKHYSSGMRMRLGFAIAAHVDPEILLVDEVLAVGDESFQHKCLDRIMEMRQRGVTICYVSHGLGSVRRLCSRAVWLNEGAIQAEGRVDDVISAYLRHAADEEESRLRGASRPVGRDGDPTEPGTRLSGESEEIGQLEITEVALRSATGRGEHVFRVGEPWAVEVHYRSREPIDNARVSLKIHRNDGLCVCESSAESGDLGLRTIEGEGTVSYGVDALPLMEGTYFLSVSFQDQADATTFDCRDHAHTFRTRQVGSGERYGLVTLWGGWEWCREGEHPHTEKLVAQQGCSQAGDLGPERRWGTGDVAIVDVALVDAEGTERRVFETGEPWMVRLRYRADKKVDDPVFGLAVHRSDGLHICGPNTHFGELQIPAVEGQGEVRYQVEGLPLLEGTYRVSASTHNKMDTVMYDYHDRLYAFKVCQFDACDGAGVVSLSGDWNWEVKVEE